MSKKKTQATRSGSKLQVLTAEALRADKSASMAKDRARAVKARLKAAKQEFKAAKAELKAAKKLSRKAGKEAKRLQKALQTRLDRIAKHKSRQKRQATVRKSVPKVVKGPQTAGAQGVSVSPAADSPA